MARKKPHEEHENHERYLVTYADLITLLLAFFIILYAMSSVDQNKFDVFSESLSMAFHKGTPNIIDLDGTFNKNARKEVTKEELKTMKEASETNKLDQAKQKVEKEIKSRNLEENVKVTLDKEGLHIVLKNEILFASGEAVVKTEMKQILKQMSQIVSTVENPVIISGHTDNFPIRTAMYPSNWELSSARAVSVLRQMVENNPNLKADRFAASGYGEYHPVAENTTEAGRQQNRRVEILVKRMQESDSEEKEQEVKR